MWPFKKPEYRMKWPTPEVDYEGNDILRNALIKVGLIANPIRPSIIGPFSQKALQNYYRQMYLGMQNIYPYGVWGQSFNQESLLGGLCRC